MFSGPRAADAPTLVTLTFTLPVLPADSAFPSKLELTRPASDGRAAAAAAAAAAAVPTAGAPGRTVNTLPSATFASANALGVNAAGADPYGRISAMSRYCPGAMSAGTVTATFSGTLAPGLSVTALATRPSARSDASSVPS